MEAEFNRILVADDEVNIQALLREVLRKEGYEVECASSGEEGLKRLLETEWFDLVISDLKMPGLDGLEFLKRSKVLSPTLPFIMLTGYGSIDSAVTAMREGAEDYLTKPVSNEEIRVMVKRVLDLHRLTRKVEYLRSQVKIKRDFQNIIGQSKLMKTLFRLIKLVARSNSTILIQGESGTGKELIAQAIHQHSPRRDRPFVALDCGTLSDTLLESELFGHVKGSFTGAINHKKGLFEEAHRGTLVLDEIGDITLAFQSKLLRVLQESEIRPVGSNKSVKVDVRVIATTNKDLKKQVEKRSFREDLYYRLAVVPFMVPPLRQRKEDVPLLMTHFINKYCERNQLEVKRISVRALRLLVDYSWPGNVRELENTIERAVLLSPGAEINPKALSLEQAAGDGALEPLQQTTKGVREMVEREQIIEAIQKAGGNRSYAARLLGISRATFYTKLKHYQLTNSMSQR
jgi:DNA-binding NtrC family response regulator